MKVLFYIREDYLKNMAGDTILLLKIQEYLRKLEIEVAVSHSPYENLTPYDLIHLFNTIRVKETSLFFKNTRRYRKKVILSPIFWNYIDYIPKKQKSGLEEIYWAEADHLRKEIFRGVDLILPSSEVEREKIESTYPTKNSFEIIPNGVDAVFEKGNAEAFYSKYKIKDFLLCVGRICKHKNQLSLAKVTRELNIPFVMVGPVNHIEYYHQCLKANPDLIYIPKVEHLQLPSLYKAAKVHGLVSWYEIPGLANLEAGLAGCNIVTTEEGSTKEYLKNYVDYVNSDDLTDIYLKVNKAMKREKDEMLKNYIAQHYLWDRVAEKTIKVYQKVR